MRLASLGLVILSAFAHALLSLLIKKSNQKHIFCWLYNVAELVIFAPIPIYYFIYDKSAFPTLSAMLLLVGLLHYLYIFTFAKSFEHSDMSLVYPIIRSSPALVMVGSVWLLNEQVSLLGATGVLLTVVGVYLLCMRSREITSILAPFSDASRTSGTRFAILTALIATAFTLLDKVFVSTIPPILYTYILYVMTTAGLTAQIAMTTTTESIRAEFRAFALPIISCAILEVVGYVLVLIAFTEDKVSYVVGLRQISILIAVAMGGVVLKEENLRQRSLASIVIFLGILLISFAN